MNIPLSAVALLAALTAATSACAGSNHHPRSSASIRSVPTSPVLNQPSPSNRPSNYGPSTARAAPVPVPATTQQLEKNLAACMRAGRC
jgi:hypothetical protein